MAIKKIGSIKRGLLRTRHKSEINSFCRIYYDSNVWHDTRWLGIPVLKCPLDLWVYQEILFEQKPDVIIECGTAYGGSAAFLAGICDLIDSGEVLTIDVKKIGGRPVHRRIKYLVGNSVSDEVLTEVERLVQSRKALVILDSDHSKDHVLEELRKYCRFVTKGSYLIVEDAIVNGHPILEDFGEGPWEAIDEFLTENKDFVIDRSKEKFFLTFNPRGYLRRITC